MFFEQVANRRPYMRRMASKKLKSTLRSGHKIKKIIKCYIDLKGVSTDLLDKTEVGWFQITTTEIYKHFSAKQET